MRICFISHTAARNGAELALLELLKGLSTLNVQCLVFVPEKGPLVPELDKLDIDWRVVSYPWWWKLRGKSLPRRALRTLGGLAAATRIAIMLRRWRCDVVVTNTVAISTGAFAAWLARKPHVWHLHESPYRDSRITFDLGIRLSMRLIDRLSTRIVAVSHAVADDYSRYIRRDRLRVVYQSITSGAGLSQDEIGGIHYPTLDTNVFKCAIVGSLQPWKGQDEAIKALSEIVRRGIDAHLLIVGDGDSLFTTALRNQVKDYGLEHRVTFTGYVNDPTRLIQGTDVVLMCSRWEAFARVMIEAMLARKAVIASASGGTMEQIHDGETGLLYERGNHVELAEKIQYLYQNPQARLKLGQAANDWAVGRFTQERYASEMLDLFKGILTKERTSA
ncbi:glycosyltransferase involved in cell wall biosynthesis [Nitrosospira sp. Nsp2]|uniref:glycosyltransferase family 4 protein n=1 Tax=Nitrosospira sp. Nsp2 TaxID=136548 RepID=UPI000D3118B4|nr:glycosyltransferase family 4 protein [Nitrosospira sp. Nsp2]PTR16272.1 glycosyltransferase involved in cell wall biosynthesis [Nitrosospira sp. Nsp2]